MSLFKHLLSACLGAVLIIGGLSLVTFSDSQAFVKFKKAFPQASFIKRLFSKTVCGKRHPGDRYVTSKDGTEVCDRTSGVIWEQNPDSLSLENPNGRPEMTWAEAIAFCANLGKTKKHGQGYVLPSIQQLVSVFDYSNFEPVLMPEVFSNALPAVYWSVSVVPGLIDTRWIGLVNQGTVGIAVGGDLDFFVWCVRRDKEAHGEW